MRAAIGSFKGNATISLDSDSRFQFSFGLAKARMILECLPEIQAFVASNGRSLAKGPGLAPDASRDRFVADPMGVDRAYEDQCQTITGA